ncbi:MAG: hypothetical protein ABI054_08050 [Planctomycetota bacterium]
MSRRRFLAWSAAFGASLVAGLWFSWPAGRGNALSLGRRLLHAHQTPERKLLAYFHYLKIPDEVARQYVSDFREQVHDVGRLSDLEDDFFTRFLLSTDFFQNGADESRTLGYVSIYGPTITLCYNPLAKLD